MFETIRLENGILYHLDAHQRRMEKSYRRFFGRTVPFDLKKIIDTGKLPEKGVHRIRFVYGENAYYIEVSAYHYKDIKTLRIVEADDLDYSLKFTDRSAINELLKHKNGADDILIVKNGLITDTSIANIAFFDGEDWLTPASPLLEGTEREILLEQGIIKPGQIHVNDLQGFSNFKIFNAMMDFDRQPEISIRHILF